MIKYKFTHDLLTIRILRTFKTIRHILLTLFPLSVEMKSNTILLEGKVTISIKSHVCLSLNLAISLSGFYSGDIPII